MSWGGKGDKVPHVENHRAEEKKSREKSAPSGRTEGTDGCMGYVRPEPQSCWLGVEEHWQVRENPGNSQNTKLPAKHTLPDPPALRLQGPGFSQSARRRYLYEGETRNHGPSPHSLRLSLM